MRGSDGEREGVSYKGHISDINFGLVDIRADGLVIERDALKEYLDYIGDHWHENGFTRGVFRARQFMQSQGFLGVGDNRPLGIISMAPGMDTSKGGLMEKLRRDFRIYKVKEYYASWTEFLQLPFDQAMAILDDLREDQKAINAGVNAAKPPNK